MSGGPVTDAHRFGGEWTELKLDVIDTYARFYTLALKNKDFELWYIDGFAGTGRRTATIATGGLFAGEALAEKEVSLEGSARRALAVTPPFTHLVLIDQRRKHYNALCALKDEFPARDIRPELGDANDVVPAIFVEPPWKRHKDERKQRALVFIDPYGINVKFALLESLAATERCDVWLLVNLKAAVQQLAHEHDRVDASKRAALTTFFGCSEWELDFYRFQEAGTDLFGAVARSSGVRTVDKHQVAEFYRTRLETLFKYVSPPLGLKVKAQDDYFQLYCMSNNPSERARDLIKRGAEAILRKHAKASRRRSDP